LRLPNNLHNINKKFQATLEVIMKSHYDNNIKLVYNNVSGNLKLKNSYTNSFKSEYGCEINPYFRTNDCKKSYRWKSSYYICGICYARTCENCCTSDDTLGVQFQKYIKKNLSLSLSPSTATFYKTKYICNACLLTLVESVEQIKIILPRQGSVTLSDASLYQQRQRNIKMLYTLIFNGNMIDTSLYSATKTKCIGIKTYLYNRFPNVLRYIGEQKLRSFLNLLNRHNKNVEKVIHEGYINTLANLPVVTTPPNTKSQTSTAAKKKNFYTFIELLREECGKSIGSTIWLKGLTECWQAYLPFAFLERDLSEITKVILKTVLDKPGKDEKFLGNQSDIENFIEIYNQYLGNRGGPGNPVVNVSELEAEYDIIIQDEVEAQKTAPAQASAQAQAQAMLAVGGGGKKQHKYIKRKKVNVKKVGVYRSKGGYFYRRYKNGKVKRISKETYKKSKKK
jgi:hypothetical protein